jgi:hypothetical protein
VDIRYDDFLDVYLKRIRANKLVVLDSCFSGSQITLPVAQGLPQPVSQSLSSTRSSDQAGGRFELVSGGHLRRDLLSIPSRFEVETTSNSLTFIGAHSEFGFYTAAQMNKEAQEGAVSAKSINNSHFIFLDEPEAANLKSGHGLYTYELLVALEKQIPESRHMKDISGDGEYTGKWKDNDQCVIDFAQAHNSAAGAIGALGTAKRRELQMPTQAGVILVESLQCLPSGEK